MASLKQVQIEAGEMKLENLDRLWQPFLKLSRIMGAFPFFLTHGDNVGPWWRNQWNFYSVLSMLFCSGRLIIIIYFKLTGGWSISLIDVDFLSVSLFPLQLLASISAFMYFLNFTTYLNDLCHVWSSLTFGHDTAVWVTALVKKKMKFVSALCVLATLQATYGLGFEIYQMYHKGFSLTGVLYELSTAWCIIIQVIQIGLFCSLCCAISCILKGICQDMEANLANGTMGIHLKVCKDVYIAIVDLIQVSNQLFGIHVGFLVTSSLLQACFDTYTLIVHTGMHKNLFGIAIWVVYNLITAVVICLSAGHIPDQARRPYKIMVKIDLASCSSFQQNQALMLVDCLQNLDANIFIFRIIPITIQTLPTIISFYFSYVFLLFQFPTGAALTSVSSVAMNITTV